MVQARAEVVGYPEPVLEAFRTLVREVRADPGFALSFGSATAASRTLVEHGSLMGVIADLVIVTAEVAQTEART